MRRISQVQTPDRIALPRRLVPRRPVDFELDPRFAYLEWLRQEARFLQMELGCGDKGEFSPIGTFTHRYHIPFGESWRDQPQPSTRAETVLRAVGVKFPRGLLVPEDAA